MEIAAAQAELRDSYVRGGPGAIVSGGVWLIAGLVSSYSGIGYGFATLFFGGMLIFPISAMLVRGILRRPAESKVNPGGTIVVETVVPMIAGLFAAWLIMPHRPDFVFPLSAIAVGAHYFGFRTAYGDLVYWVFGAILCLVGLLSIVAQIPAHQVVPYLVALIEIVFGVALTWVGLRNR